MANFEKCPNCSNSQKGVELYKCRNCGKTFCQKCGDDKFGDVCPKCDVACQKVGEIS